MKPLGEREREKDFSLDLDLASFLALYPRGTEVDGELLQGGVVNRRSGFHGRVEEDE